MTTIKSANVIGTTNSNTRFDTNQFTRHVMMGYQDVIKPLVHTCYWGGAGLKVRFEKTDCLLALNTIGQADSLLEQLWYAADTEAATLEQVLGVSVSVSESVSSTEQSSENPPIPNPSNSVPQEQSLIALVTERVQRDAEHDRRLNGCPIVVEQRHIDYAIAKMREFDAANPGWADSDEVEQYWLAEGETATERTARRISWNVKHALGIERSMVKQNEELHRLPVVVKGWLDNGGINWAHRQFVTINTRERTVIFGEAVRWHLFRDERPAHVDAECIGELHPSNCVQNWDGHDMRDDERLVRLNGVVNSVALKVVDDPEDPFGLLSDSEIRANIEAAEREVDTAAGREPAIYVGIRMHVAGQELAAWVMEQPDIKRISDTDFDAKWSLLCIECDLPSFLNTHDYGFSAACSTDSDVCVEAVKAHYATLREADTDDSDGEAVALADCEQADTVEAQAAYTEQEAAELAADEAERYDSEMAETSEITYVDRTAAEWAELVSTGGIDRAALIAERHAELLNSGRLEALADEVEADEYALPNTDSEWDPDTDELNFG